MSDRPYEHRGDQNPGSLEESDAPWAGKSAPAPISLGNDAPSTAAEGSLMNLTEAKRQG
jgi:hypothetical protein